MDQPRPFFVRYPVFASTIVLAIIGGVLALTGLEDAARWVISIFALAIAAKESVGHGACRRGWRAAFGA